MSVVPPYLECRQCAYGTTDEFLADEHSQENPEHRVYYVDGGQPCSECGGTVACTFECPTWADDPRDGGW